MHSPGQHHRVRGLKWAELRPESPFPEKKVRAKRYIDGLAFEKRVGRFLKKKLAEGAYGGDLHLGQWILFADASGVGFAQPDAYIVPLSPSEPILLMECKLTQTDAAVPQLISLYLPLLRKIYNRPILCLQICKHLRYRPPKLVESISDLLQNPGPGVFTWHYPLK